MSNEAPNANEPTEEEVAAMRSATAEEARAVDALILEAVSEGWQKVARVVGQLLNAFDREFEHLPYAYLQARMQELEDLGKLEIAGDVWAMRHSEVRLVNRSEPKQNEV